ncbi:MAG: aspartate aminotransferase family protein, partial [Elusimicrobia bacterium]|nr:aspartate aminotransferase family protein [Elusimicrobiota bacterium]
RFKAAPRLLAEAKGVWYRDVDGRDVLDGAAGLWCVNAGHGRVEIADAVHKQLLKMDYAPTFQMGHPLPFEAAHALKAILPEAMDAVFFTNSGSESADTSLKIALAYHLARGEPERNILVGRQRGYHGVNFGGISVGGIPHNQRQFGPLLQNVDHIRHTHDLDRNAFSKGQPAQGGVEMAEDLLRVIETHGGDRIAAVIVEPMAGSTGVLLPPHGYLERLREICSEHGVLLIFDEVITGFGRLGAAFGAQKYGVTPDIMGMAKGLTNGAIPMGAVAVTKDVRDTIVETSDPLAVELFHGYTYSGHPAACVAALATLDIYRNEGLFERCAELAPYWQDAVHSLRGEPWVIDLRNEGLVGGVELEPRPGAPGKRGYDVYVDAFWKGALIRVTGDTLAMSPPLIIEKPEIDKLIDTVRAALKAVA